MTTYAYTSTTLVKNELRATADFATTTNPSLSTVTNWINEESEYINGLANNVFTSTSFSEIVDYNGGDVITLANAPVISITSVLYSPYSLGDALYNLSDTKVADTDYSCYNESGELIILPSWKPSIGRKRIQINYTAGYSSVPLDVQKLATKLVANRVLSSLIHNNINTGADGGSISVGSISIVEPASYGVNSYKQLGTDIADLEKQVAKTSGMHRYSQRY